MTMTNPNLEEFINQRIDVFPYKTVLKDSLVTDEFNFYTVSEYQGDLLSKKFNQLVVTTNKKDIIQSINFSLNGDLDQLLFNRLVEKYGSPVFMKKPGKILNKELEVLDNVTTTTTTRSELIDCNFEDNPSVVQWIRNEIPIKFIIIKRLSRIDVVIGNI